MSTPIVGEPSPSIVLDGEDFDRSELLQQVERLTTSKHFRNSKRYPSFLRFVVEQTLAGNTEGLKERNLGTDVFGRPSDYDTNADPIVRVTAGEIRKRIAQYYQEQGHEQELRIDLPLGSYVPHFFPAPHSTGPHDNEAQVRTPSLSHSDTAEPASKLSRAGLFAAELTGRMRWRAIALACGVVVPLLIGLVLLGGRQFREESRDNGISYFWNQTVSSKNPALIVIGVHTLDRNGHDIPPDVNGSNPHDSQQSMLSAMIHADMVPVSDIVSYSKITDLLTRRFHIYETKSSAETTLEELRHGPVILIGALDNIWTLRLTSTLRYHFYSENGATGEIQDSRQPSTTWKFDNTQLALANSSDYAIVASYFDPTIEQHVIIAAGIGKTGTQAASEFLTSDKDLASWLAQAKLPRDKNIELVLSTEILDGQAGPPHVVASYSW